MMLFLWTTLTSIPHGILARVSKFWWEVRGFESWKSLLAVETVQCQQFGTVQALLSYPTFAKYHTECYQLTVVSGVGIELVCLLV